MSSIEKLSIRGIRSFSPNREEIIEFYHPLTVILGENGAGKTTIIECLKMAITGVLPPGSRSGQTFIHDPRIAGTTEVKASIRLRFRNRAGKPMVAQRTFQLVHTKSTYKYKALDGVIRIVDDHGEKISMSHKCAELDRHIPEMLGVSKAILDSVLFCHQEDSNWPLMEGSVLKKRFDDIFESARYTKALEAIRKLKSARATLAKEYQSELAVLSVKVKNASDIQEKIETIEEKLRIVREEVGKLDDQVDADQETLEEMEQLLEEIKNEHAALDKLHSDVTQKAEDVSRAYGNLEEVMSDTDAELQVLLNNFDTIVDEQRHAFQLLQDKESQLLTAKTSAQEEYSRLCTSKGNMEARIEAQQALISELLDMATKTGTKYRFHPQQLSSQEDEIKSFTSKFERFVNEKQTALAQLEAQHQATEDTLNSNLSDLKAGLHHAKEDLKTKQRELGTVNAEKRKVAAKLKDFEGSSIPTARDVAENDRLIADSEKALQRYKEQRDLHRLKEQIEKLNMEIQVVNVEINSLKDKIKVLSLHENERVALEAKRAEHAAHKDDFNSRIFEKAIEYKSLLNGLDSLDESSLPAVSRQVAEVVAKKKELCERFQKEYQQSEERIQENRLSSKLLEKNLAALRSEKSELERSQVGDLKKVVVDILGSDDIRSAEVALQRAEKSYFDAKDKTLRCKNTITFLGIFKQKGLKDKCCPLCTRGMSQEEQEVFKRVIDEKTDDKKVKDKIKKAETHEAAAFAKWKSVENAMPAWRKWLKLEDSLPEKSNELDALYTAQRALQEDVKDKKRQYDAAVKQLAEAERAHQDFEQLCENAKNVRRGAAQIEEEEERLRQMAINALGTNAPSLAELQASFDEKHGLAQDLSHQCQQKQTELQRAHEMQQQLQNDYHTKTQMKFKLEEKRREHDDTKKEQEVLRSREKELREKITELSDVEPRLEQEVRDKAAEVKAHRSNASAQQQELRKEVQNCMEDFRMFSDTWKKLARELSQDLDKELDRLGDQIAQTKQKQIATTQALEEIAPQLANVRQSMTDQETTKRKIRDNMDYRRLRKELDVARVEMETAKQKISNLPSMDDVNNRVRAAKLTVGTARDRRSTLRGRQAQLEEQIHDCRVQLRSSELRNIEEKHRQMLIKHETTVMAVADLDKYYKALDQSLLQFHSKKVEEINSIIRSLWQITYKGQDIDTIEVVSGQDNDTGGSRASRSYDYRVVMKKGGALIDMRGRCSAGQKVLAALVIRLALAETFCLSCGVLALDEPTTNLDTENKFGLAQAITDILNARSAQHNFQLVCITHDEEFVQMLSQAQAMEGTRPEYYWRVSREDIGNNRFCSRVERKEWHNGI